MNTFCKTHSFSPTPCWNETKFKDNEQLARYTVCTVQKMAFPHPVG